MTNPRLQQLIDAWRDNDLTDNQAEELNQMLRESEDARRTFASESQLHGLLHCAVDEEIVRNIAAGAPTGTPSSATSAPWSKAAVAMCAFAAGLVVFAIPWWYGRSSSLAKQPKPGIRVAEVRFTDGSDFAANPGPDRSTRDVIEVGRRLSPGGYRLSRGFVELDFFGGAVLALQGPAEIEFISQREARLLKGRLTVQASESGEPFLLHTPAGEIVDIGTRYGAFVDPTGSVETHVFEGLVDIHAASSPHSVRRVKANSALRINAAGASEPLPADETTFPQPSRQVSDALRDAGFENGTDLQVGDSPQPGVWQGDVCRIVDRHQSVTPYAGDAMLLFQSTGRDKQRGGKTAASQLAQWIDLSPWQDVIADGRVQAKLTARFNRVAGDAETDSQFSIQLESFNVGLEQAVDSLKTRHLARSRTNYELLSDSDPESWEKLEAVLTLPANSRCLQVMILAYENVVNDDNAGEEFDGHFADDLTFQLMIDPASGNTK